MRNKQPPNFILKDIDKLLTNQTATILKKVDSRFAKEREITDKRFKEAGEIIYRRFEVVDRRFGVAKEETESLLSQQTIVILGAVDEKLKETELKINEKIDQLITTLDGFLKRLTVAVDLS